MASRYHLEIRHFNIQSVVSHLIRMKKEGIADPTVYLKFFGLRTHGIMCNNEPATEMVYVHSKLMIVDDRIAVIGSANINDRSMVGSRDSELAVVITDSKERTVVTNEELFTVKEFAHSLRITCWSQIFGLDNPIEAMDPLSKEFWDKINDRVEVDYYYQRKTQSCTGKYLVVIQIIKHPNIPT